MLREHVLLCFALFAIAAQGQLLPGSVPPLTKIDLLGSPSSITLGGAKTPKGPVIVHLYDPTSIFAPAMWIDESLPRFLTWLASSDDATFLILPTSGSSEQLQKMMHSALALTNLTASAAKRVESRLFFAEDANNDTNWIAELSQSWPNSLNFINVSLDDGQQLNLQRLDARDWWLPPLMPGGSYPYVYIGDACQPNSFALISGDGNCDYFTMLVNAENAGAVGAIVVSPQGQPPTDMTCGNLNGAECNSNEPVIPATMVSYTDGQALIAQAANVSSISFYTSDWPVLHFAIDAEGKLREIGWVVWPAFDFLTWGAQELAYKQSLSAKLSSAYGSHTQVEIARNQSFLLAQTVQTFEMKLPQYNRLNSASSLMLDMQLSCNGSFDFDCPIWDYVLAAYICCNENCTVQNTPDDSAVIGYELGRWITPFRRNSGRWLTDVSLLLPLISSPTCNITVTLPPELGATPWVISLSLLFGEEAQYPATFPEDITPLWNGMYTFDSTYNHVHTPVNFTRPVGATRALFYSVITGHGSDNNNCGEFCVTSHVFTLNGYSWNETFSQAGTEYGCTTSIPSGEVANQHGTWIFGRDGWCDGSDVKPFVLDITKHVHKAGEYNLITYQGLFNGSTPNPMQSPGDMVVSTYIVWVVNGKEPNYRFALILSIVSGVVLLGFCACAMWQRTRAKKALFEKQPLLSTS